jgi:hypothetical protein
MKKISGISEKNKSGILLFIFSCLLFLYVSIRAYLIDITWDEAYSYLKFIRTGNFSPFYYSGVSANNHLLNTWLSFLTSYLFGVSEFTLRIPNIIAYALFLFFTAKLSNEFSSPLLRISSFLILNLNPYLVDFFSMSRGYGLSFSLMAGSLWYLYRFLKNNFQSKDSLRSLLFAMAAVFAYLTLIHFAIALFICILFIDFFNSEKNQGLLKRFSGVLKKNYSVIIFFILFLCIIIPRILGLKKADALFYGGTQSFWHDTVLTVFQQSFYGKYSIENLKNLLGNLALIITTVAFFISVKTISKNKNSHAALILPLICFLLLYCSIISIVQHYLLSTPYYSFRTALFLLLLFSFMLVFLFDELAKTKKIITYTLPAICFILIAHFCYSVNTKYVFEYYLNADMKEMMHDIDSLKKEIPAQKFSMDVGISYDFLEPFNYYRCVNKLTGINVADKFGISNPLNDFYLFTEDEYKKIHADSFTVLKTYPLFNNMLLKKKYTPLAYTIRLSQKMDFDLGSGPMKYSHTISDNYFFSGKTSGLTSEKNEYSDGISYHIDTTKTPVKNSVLLIKTMILMEHLDNSDASIVVSFENKKQIYYWHATLVSDFATQAKEWFPVYFSCLIPEEVQQDDLLMIYLWNKKSPVYVDDMEMRWISGAY